ncbi:hypothetical protein KSB_92230 [Ktedonobacter robiniae]|uniref:Uncharacterized protein n=1 Tax=Ktedonobacter robiniae TaxID=2778365 RepID=A0ABQ3V707_9CHLR|nr:hypothetical protein KSB_92230 [Ktedonobacter robiniae]
MSFHYFDARSTSILEQPRQEKGRNPHVEACFSSISSTILIKLTIPTRQTQAPSEAEYVSPVTRTWLHAQLAPTIEG